MLETIASSRDVIPRKVVKELEALVDKQKRELNELREEVAKTREVVERFAEFLHVPKTVVDVTLYYEKKFRSLERRIAENSVALEGVDKLIGDLVSSQSKWLWLLISLFVTAVSSTILANLDTIMLGIRILLGLP